MRALNLKLWRDLLRLRGQVATIALVVGCGVAGFVGAFSTHASLEASRDRYYRDAAFADVFGAVRRAPLALRDRIAAIDGVAALRHDVPEEARQRVLAVDGPPARHRHVFLRFQRRVPRTLCSFMPR